MIQIQSRVQGAMLNSFRTALAAVLCLLMVGQPLLAATPDKKTPASTSSVSGIQGDLRIVHALNRFTFGPRPGDVEAVKAMGLDKWFEQQLNPGKLDDHEMEARLALYPAMQLKQEQLIQRFPTNQVIRGVETGLIPMPSDPVEHAIYATQLAVYKKVKAAQAAGLQPGQALQAANNPEMVQNGAAANADGANGMNAQDMNAQDNAMQGAMDSAMKPTATPADAASGNRAGILIQKLTPEEKLQADLKIQELLTSPPDQRVARIIAMSPKDLIALHQSMEPADRLEMVQGMSPQQKEILAALQNPRQMVDGEVLSTRLVEDIYSSHQLEAVMTDFWLNHFNVYIKKNQQEAYYLPAYEREVIRLHALGNFEDLLVATAKSPAMLFYLDNWSSIGPDSQAVTRAGDGRYAGMLALRNPQAAELMKQQQAQQGKRGLNENYARELMELHTVGVNGGYTQQDVTQVAKVFTGWTIDKPYRGGSFNFEERRHEPGTKVVMGMTISENGEKEGLEVLHMLATSPKTAHFISYKLAVRFVSDNPPDALVNRMADSFLASKGDIKTVLRTMFQSPEFWAPEAYRAKVKTPLEYVVSAVRASNAEVKSPLPLAIALDRLGMPLYGMQTPNGYSWKADEWVSTSALVSRMNFALSLSANYVPGVQTDWSGLLGEGIASSTPDAAAMLSPQAKEHALEGFLLNGPASEKTRAAVLAQADNTAPEDAAMKFPLRLDDYAQFGAVNQAEPGKNGGKGGGKTYTPPAPSDRQASVMAGLLIGSPEFQRR